MSGPGTPTGTRRETMKVPLSGDASKAVAQRYKEMADNFELTKKRYKQQEQDRLSAVRGDIAEWLNTLLPDSDLDADCLMEKLGTGVAMCMLAQLIEKTGRSPTKEQRELAKQNEQRTRSLFRDLKTSAGQPMDLKPHSRARRASFFARDNAMKFTRWCVALGLPEQSTFDTNDLVEGRNEKSVLFCLLEIGRMSARVGLPTPRLVELEMGIRGDDENENDDLLASFLAEEKSGAVAQEEEPEPEPVPEPPPSPIPFPDRRFLGRAAGLGDLAGDGGLEDSRFSASSAQPGAEAYRARLNGTGCWQPATGEAGEALEVDLGAVQLVTRVMTQGSPIAPEWVSEFTLAFSVDGEAWLEYIERDDHGEPRRFAGNSDATSVVRSDLGRPPVCRFVRVTPTAWVGPAPSLRCEFWAHGLGQPVGLASGRLPDSRLSASSEHGPKARAALARLGHPHAWRPAADRPDEYLQLDLGAAHTVTALLVQGCANTAGTALACSLETSLDGRAWRGYGASATATAAAGSPAFEQRGADGFGVEGHFLWAQPTARFLRLSAQTWRSHIALRLEVYHEPLGVPLGLEDGGVPDACLSASGSRDGAHPPGAGRLHHAACWSAPPKASHPYLQVDCDAAHVFTGFAVQGGRGQHVTALTLQFLVGGKWTPYGTDAQGAMLELAGCEGDDDVAVHRLPEPVYARAARICPTAWHAGCSLRAELYVASRTARPVGMESGAIRDGQLKASTRISPTSAPSRARLDGPASWIPKPSDKRPWLEVDLGRVQLLTGVVVQGSATTTHRVTEYTLASSVGGASWADYEDAERPGRPCRIHVAATRRDACSAHTLRTPVVARFVRVRPTKWTGSASLRCELLADDLGQPLGIEDGRVPDRALSASSSASANHEPQHSRLNGPWGWSPVEDDGEDAPYLQVDLGAPTTACAVLVQGAASGAAVATSLDGRAWRPAGRPELPRTPAVDDGACGVVLQGSPLARHVRLALRRTAQADAEACCGPLRWEVLGRPCGAYTGIAATHTGPGRVGDGQLQGSSEAGGATAALGRLDGPAAWAPASGKEAGAFLEVDLRAHRLITGVLTQGHAARPEWVERYTMDTSLDGRSWTPYTARGASAVEFAGNDDAVSVRGHSLAVPPLARFVRVAPRAWHGRPALRLELLSSGVGQPLGLEDGRVLDEQFLASTSQGPGHDARAARLNNAAGAWVPAASDARPFLSVALSCQHAVTAVLLQGQAGQPGRFCRELQLECSPDGDAWASVSAAPVPGNSSADTMASFVFPGRVVARHVRFRPTAGTGSASPALRLELLGHLVGVPVGLEDGRVPDAALSSNVAPEAARHCRLNTAGAAWGAASGDADCDGLFIQVELDEPCTLVGLATQGDPGAEEEDGGCWVTQYSLAYSPDGGKNWFDYEEDGLCRTFEGNEDAGTTAVRTLAQPIEARLLRVYPRGWHGRPRLRLELLRAATAPLGDGAEGAGAWRALEPAQGAVLTLKEQLEQVKPDYTAYNAALEALQELAKNLQVSLTTENILMDGIAERVEDGLGAPAELAGVQRQEVFGSAAFCHSEVVLCVSDAKDAIVAKVEAMGKDVDLTRAAQLEAEATDILTTLHGEVEENIRALQETGDKVFPARDEIGGMGEQLRQTHLAWKDSTESASYQTDERVLDRLAAAQRRLQAAAEEVGEDPLAPPPAVANAVGRVQQCLEERWAKVAAMDGVPDRIEAAVRAGLEKLQDTVQHVSGTIKKCRDAEDEAFDYLNDLLDGLYDKVKDKMDKENWDGPANCYSAVCLGQRNPRTCYAPTCPRCRAGRQRQRMRMRWARLEWNAEAQVDSWNLGWRPSKSQFTVQTERVKVGHVGSKISTHNRKFDKLKRQRKKDGRPTFQRSKTIASISTSSSSVAPAARAEPGSRQPSRGSVGGTVKKATKASKKGGAAGSRRASAEGARRTSGDGSSASAIKAARAKVAAKRVSAMPDLASKGGAGGGRPALTKSKSQPVAVGAAVARRRVSRGAGEGKRGARPASVWSVSAAELADPVVRAVHRLSLERPAVRVKQVRAGFFKIGTVKKPVNVKDIRGKVMVQVGSKWVPVAAYFAEVDPTAKA